jgi:hypothetical protein
MSAADPILQEMAGAGGGREVFALTDEQIVGVEPDAEGITEGKSRPVTEAAEGVTNKGGVSHQEAEAHEPPGWLAERMRDPWHGEEAKEFWDGKQRAEKEASEYREVFATAADARALKEIYPGGVNEARTAAERARAMDEIDAAFYRGDGAARAQLARQMMQQNPAAFREMVEAGVRLLGTDGKTASSGERQVTSQNAGQQQSQGEGNGAQDLSPEVVGAYTAFEKAANAELEKSVGGAIARMMEQALPNLRMMDANGREGPRGSAPLQERLAGAVREEVETALKSDGQLGEQVAKILAGQRFDEGARAQVVRLIDARAQQLVPGAVRCVVGSWTQATLGVRGKTAEAGREESGETPRRATSAPARRENERPVSTKNEKTVAARRETGNGRGRRVDYGRFSDEDILGM